MGELSLSQWMRALTEYVRSGSPDLTNRQMAILLMVYQEPGPHTVRGLAQKLGVSKPVVTRALNTLGGYGYLRRERDQDDRRNIFIVQTEDGAEFLAEFERHLGPASNGSAGGNGRYERTEPRQTEREPAYAH